MSLETFASPSLRWGLLLEDHPGATQSCEMRQGSTLGIPDQFGGAGDFCACTITIPGREPVTAWKAVPGRGEADIWVVACTKTLGRALKKAGYPDDLNDLKGLMHWRQREAEIAAILGGNVLAQGTKPLEIEAGGKDADDDDTMDDDGDRNPPDDSVVGEIVEKSRPAPKPQPEPVEEIAEAEIIEDVAAEPEPEVAAEMKGEDRDEVNAERIIAEVKSLVQGDKENLKTWLADNNITPHPDDWDDETLDAIDQWLNS